MGRAFNYVILGGGTVAGYAALEFVNQGFDHGKLCIILEEASLQGLLKSWFGGRTVRHVLILFQNMLLSSTLPLALQKRNKLEESLMKEWPGINAWHVGGYRYLYCDWDNRVFRFSSGGKVATLATESFATLNRIWADIDLEIGRMERRTSTRDREFELCVRTKQNAWVIVCSRGGHDLGMSNICERVDSNQCSTKCGLEHHSFEQIICELLVTDLERCPLLGDLYMYF